MAKPVERPLEIEEKLVKQLQEVLPEEVGNIRAGVRAALISKGHLGPAYLIAELPFELRVKYLSRSLFSLPSSRIEATRLLSQRYESAVDHAVYFRNLIESREDFPLNDEVFEDLCYVLSTLFEDNALELRIFRRESFKRQFAAYSQGRNAIEPYVFSFINHLLLDVSFQEIAPFTVDSPRFNSDLLKQISGNEGRGSYLPYYLVLLTRCLKIYRRQPTLLAMIEKVKQLFEPLTQVQFESIGNDLTETFLADNGCGITREEIFRTFDIRVRSAAEKALEHSINTPLGKAVLHFVRQEQPKRFLFSESAALRTLRHPQNWITLNPPSQARALYEMVIARLPDKKQVFHRSISTFLKRSFAQLTDEDFRFYADEIIDGTKQFVANSALRDDVDLQAALAACSFDFRYSQRTQDDIKTGDKTGDCTAVGSVNFEKSLSWQVNPLYQMLLLKRGGRFLGRMNFTLGSLGKDPILLVDAVEFNPQTEHEVTGSYQEDATQVLRAAVGFLLNMARREGRRLIVLTQSNSSDFELELEAFTRHRRFGKVRSQFKTSHMSLGIENPVMEVKSTLTKCGYSGEVKLWYQSAEHVGPGAAGMEERAVHAGPPDRLLARLEREVLNPGQQQNPTLATAMRSRDFQTAADIVLSSYGPVLEDLFGSTPEKDFLVRKMAQVYPVQQATSTNPMQYFQVEATSFLEVFDMTEAA